MKRFFSKIIHMDKESLTVLPVGIVVSFVAFYFNGWYAGWGYQWLNIVTTAISFALVSVVVSAAFTVMMKRIHEKETPTLFDALKVAAIPCVILFVLFERVGW